MTAADIYRALGMRGPGTLEEMKSVYVSRRRDLEERMGAAPTKGLAGAYLAEIEELDAAFSAASAAVAPTPPRAASLSSGLAAVVSRARVVEVGGGPEALPTGAAPVGSGTQEHIAEAPVPRIAGLPAVEVKMEVAETPGLDSASDALTGAAVGAVEPGLTARIAILGALAAMGTLAVGIAIVVLIGLQDPDEPLPGDQAHVVQAPARPLSIASAPDAPVAPREEKRGEGAISESVLAAEAAEAVSAARGLAEAARAGFENAEKPDGEVFASAARALLLMERAEKAPAVEDPATLAVWYRQAAEEFTNASEEAAAVLAGRALERANASAERWSGVPERGRWENGVKEAMERLEAGRGLLNDGATELARGELGAAGAALDAMWGEYLLGSIEAAHRDAGAAFEVWNAEFTALSREGLVEPAEVARAKAQLTDAQEQLATQETLAALRGAVSSFSAATERLRADRGPYDAARGAAERARERFAGSKKPAGMEFPGAVRAEALMAEAGAALRTEGLAGAAGLYSRAADVFAGELAVAAVAAAERAEAQRRTALAGIAALRSAVDEVAGVRAEALARLEREWVRLERLRALAEGGEPSVAAQAREQLAGAEADVQRAARAVGVLGAAGIRETGVEGLRDAVARAQDAEEKDRPWPAGVLEENLRAARRLGAAAGMVEGAVAAEIRARALAEKWKSVSSEETEQWKGRLAEPGRQLEGGMGLLSEGKVGEASQELSAAADTYHRLWEEYIDQAVREARRSAGAALARWDSLFAEHADAGRQEPAEVVRARGAMQAAGAAWGAETELAELGTIETLLAGATADLRTQLAAISPSAGDGLAPFLSAVRDGNLVLVGSLIRQGADVNRASEGGETPLVIAVGKGNVEIAAALLEAGADRGVSAPDGRPLVFVSVSSPSTLALFLDEAGRTRYRGRTILHEIAASGVERKVTSADQVTMAGMVLERFPGMFDERDALGLQAMDVARQRGAKPLTWFLSQWKPKQ